MNTEDRHAAIEMLKVEVAASLRRRWTALSVLVGEDIGGRNAIVLIALVEVMLEMVASTCPSPEEFAKMQRTLGLFLAGHLVGSPEHAALWRRARRIAGEPI